MKTRSNTVLTILLMAIGLSIFATQLLSCEKDTDSNDVVDCPVSGTYSGTSTPNVGNPSATVYSFEANNFAIGRLTVGGPGVTFGGYRNTCDSIILSVYYSGNSSYYLLKGRFSNNRNTISGSFNNLTTTSDFGTFTISK